MNSEDSVKSGSKADIRKTIKAVRNAMDRGDCAWRSELICRRLSELPEYENALNICAYISKGNEVDTKLIIERAWSDGKHVYVPKVYGQDMEFIEITDYGELASGNFGILEPVSDDFEEIEDGLMHLSKENNFEELAYETVKLELENNSYANDVREFGLAVARRDMPMAAIEA